ncbi:MAG: hypothetical protein QM664_12525 [Flavihumibacter sp.]
MKKHSWLLWLFAGLMYLPCRSQIDQEATRLTHYVLPAFTAGKVLLKNGSVSQQMLNYNVLTSEMIFDAGGEKYMAIADPASVDTVYLGDRKFIPSRKGFAELVYLGKYPLVIVYEGRVVEQGEDIGFGISSQAGASQALKTMVQNGSSYGMKLPDGFQVCLMEQYATGSNVDWEKFSSFNALAKLISAKKQVINEAVKTKKLDFKNRKDMLELFRLINE